MEFVSLNVDFVNTVNPHNGLYLEKEPMVQKKSTNESAPIYTCSKSAPYCCKRCKFRAYLKVCIKTHVERVHRCKKTTSALDIFDIANSNYSQTKNLELHKCDQCDFSTCSILVQLKHILTHETTKFLDGNLTTNDYTDIKCGIVPVKHQWFRCSRCLYKTESKHLLNIHERAIHQLRYQWRQCHLCSYTTIIKSLFESHLRIKHKSFKCKHFYSRTADCNILKIHKFVHHVSKATVEETIRSRYYECKFCLHRIQKKEVGTKHVPPQRRIEKQFLICKQCHFKTADRNSWESHKLAHHTFNPQQHNKFCKSVVENEQVLSKHATDADQCETTDLSSLETYELAQHTSKVHLNKSFPCQFCDYTVEKKPLLKQHVLDKHKTKHLGRLKCKQWHFKTADVNCWETHKLPQHTFNTEQQNKLFHDQICKSRVQNEQMISKHAANADQCETNELAQHTSKVHLNKLFPCEFCDYAVEKKPLLKQHVLDKHIKDTERFKSSNLNNLEQHKVQENKLFSGEFFEHLVLNRREYFRCKQCFFKTIYPDRLEPHRLVHHTSEMRRKLLHCQFCDYRVRDIHILNNHVINKHSVIMWYKCSHCFYKTKLRSSLNQHVRNVHWNSSLVKQRTYLIRSSDENAGTFSCEHCPFKAKLESSLATHVRENHRDSGVIKWHVCEFCDFKTEQWTSWNMHVLSEHTLDECIVFT